MPKKLHMINKKLKGILGARLIYALAFVMTRVVDCSLNGKDSLWKAQVTYTKALTIRF